MLFRRVYVVCACGGRGRSKNPKLKGKGNVPFRSAAAIFVIFFRILLLGELSPSAPTSPPPFQNRSNYHPRRGGFAFPQREGTHVCVCVCGGVGIGIGMYVCECVGEVGSGGGWHVPRERSPGYSGKQLPQHVPATVFGAAQRSLLARK